MKISHRTYLAGFVFACFLTLPHAADAQGCIVARSAEQSIGPETQGGYLLPGEWQVGVGLRHQFSFRHFVGDVEQTYRIQQGTQVMNKINLFNLDVTYQATPRLGVSLDAPVLLASRRAHNSPYTNTAQGLGDIAVTGQMWLFDPRENTKGNIQAGLGFVAPTGRDDVKNTVDLGGGRVVTMPVDYSIQPGSGGWGLVFTWASFKNVSSSSQIYFNGSYIATPQDTNGVKRFSTRPIDPRVLYASISDQYLLEAGFAQALRRVRRLTLTLGPRWEGVPASDLIGASNGFRRPGYAVSIEPGFQYAYGRHIVTGSVGKAILRDRTRSTFDKQTGGHGDAAFADYVWLLSYSYRFGGHHTF